MQTFITSYDGDWVYTAQTLDNLRPNRQALEGWQILLTLLELDPSGEYRPARGWVNHPATKMWRGYEYELASYGSAMCREWIKRGYRDSLSVDFELWRYILDGKASEAGIPRHPVPPWLGDERLHASHRSNLLRKDPKYYAKFGWTEPDDMPYVWPVD